MRRQKRYGDPELFYRLERLVNQTDALKDRPPSPLFMPEKIAQIKKRLFEDGDLFDDAEVAPILEIL